MGLNSKRNSTWWGQMGMIHDGFRHEWCCWQARNNEQGSFSSPRGHAKKIVYYYHTARVRTWCWNDYGWRLGSGLWETMSITMLEAYLPFSESSDEKPKLGCTPRSARLFTWLHIWSLLSAWGAPIHAPGDFCVLQVQVDRNHEKIFFGLHYAWSWTQIREHKKQHLKYYIYKQSHGSAEIRSLYHVLTASQNQELLLSIYKWSHGSAKIQSLYRMSTLRALLASQHETCSVQNSHQQRRSNSEGTPKNVSCFQGEHSTFNNDWVGEEPWIVKTMLPLGISFKL